MEVHAKVIDVTGNKIIVTLEKQYSCRNCDAKMFCGVRDNNKCELNIDNQLGANIGDEVIICLSKYSLCLLFFSSLALFWES